MTKFSPTPEQTKALELFLSGESMVIEAGAGTGKTSTLILLAEAVPELRGQYVAFNKSIVTEAGHKMPENVGCSTAHSLAHKAVGYRYKGRLNAPRVKPWDLARMLDVDKFVIRYGSQTKTLDSGYIAGLVMRAVTKFCQTADVEPSRWHVPYIDGIDVPDANGNRTYANNDRLRDAIEAAIEAAWRDIQKVDGRLPFKHEHYLKLWQLSDPKLDVDFVMLDEAQDANPVIAAIVEAQTCQKIYVGDSQQQIYEFTGAVNAMRGFDASHRVFLSQSFRFGQAVADRANLVLGKIADAELRISGFDKIASTVGSIGSHAASAVLCRTNARTVEVALKLTDAGLKVHLLGGGKEIAAFARGAQALLDGRHSSHPDLACFESWGEVQTYVENDPQGGELAALVKLVDDFGVDVILRALDSSVPENRADVTVSTAHKAKGREWARVRIENDFPREISEPGEFRLLYVAVTRAQEGLDDSGVAHHYDPEKAAQKADEALAESGR